MFKRKLSFSDYLLIIVNLIPLYGVWFEGWNAAQVFLVYCLETVIIGIITILKMAFVTLFIHPKNEWQNQGGSSMQSGWFFILFFLVHYGFFVFIQTQIFFAVSGLVKGDSKLGYYTQVPALLGNNGKLLLMIFITYYIVQTFSDFFLNDGYKNTGLSRLMFQPYIRIFVQQFVVIIGSMFLGFGAGKIFILILVVTKIFFEVFINFSRMLKVEERKSKKKLTKQ